MNDIKIIDLHPHNQAAIARIANLMLEVFSKHWASAWPNLDSAKEEIEASFGRDRVSRIATSETGEVLGWIGGIKQYDGHVWELHPLLVHPAYRQRGIGRALVRDLENIVRDKGGLTLWVGTDDEDDRTSLSRVNLYDNLWEHIENIKNLDNHPYEFYQKCGFAIVGVMPDANGKGKPDIFMAKSLVRSSD